MGNKQNAMLYHERNAQSIARRTGIDDYRLNRLREQFMLASRDGRMSKNEFINFYANLTSTYHIRGSYDEASRLFHAMDLDGNGHITFDEFLLGYFLFNGNDPGYGTPQSLDYNQVVWLIDRLSKTYRIPINPHYDASRLFAGKSYPYVSSNEVINYLMLLLQQQQTFSYRQFMY